ncbi:MAG: arylesterase [Methylophilaceae bacterium]|nr:MAG: arylesterase [Methylophilaceae bacterium]
MKVNYFLSPARVLLFFTVLVLSACGGADKLPAIPTGSTVLVLGDSLSYGTGAKEGEDYPTLLAQSTGWDVINAGVPGDTSAQGLARLPELLEEYQPKLLMIVLGGNDFLKKVPLAQTEKNLKAIIQAAKLKNIATLIIAIPDYQPVKAAFGGLSDHSLYATLAEETQTPLIEETFTNVLSKNSLKADYVHPNAKGYKQVEAQLRASLMELGVLNAQ